MSLFDNIPNPLHYTRVRLERPSGITKCYWTATADNNTVHVNWGSEGENGRTGSMIKHFESYDKALGYLQKCMNDKLKRREYSRVF